MCDTFVALPASTLDGAMIFGKNSDREPNEAQALEYYPAMEHMAGETVRCTYISVPQAVKTNAVILSRPFWMWGAEIGANEKGVVIGNEAVWTKMPLNTGPALTGMDLLRLALERGDSAESALEVIIKHLHDFGQGGICGYEDKKMSYHNSYIIADPAEAWVLETAGKFWAAKKVERFYSISNALTIGADFDLNHPDLIPHAEKMGWLKKGRDFDFRKCYSDWMYTTFSAAAVRRQQTQCSLEDSLGQVDLKKAMNMLRKHHSDPYHPDKHLLGTGVCAHAGNGVTRNATQTTASMVAHINKGINTFWVTATAAPCISLFKPIRFGLKEFPSLGPVPTGKFDPAVYWWHHELLHRTVISNYQPSLPAFLADLDRLQNSFIEKHYEASLADFSAFSEYTFRESEKKSIEWLEKIKQVEKVKKPGFIYSQFWKKQNRNAGFPADSFK
jgi:secernin